MTYLTNGKFLFSISTFFSADPRHFPTYRPPGLTG
jgi:hypothetical protein